MSSEQPKEPCIHSGLCRLGAPADEDCYGEFGISCPCYSRPHSSPCETPELCSLLREQKAKARKAREQVLRELTQRLDENIGSMEDCVVEMKNLRNINHTMNKIETFREVIGIAESLRAQQQGGVSE